MLQRTDPQSWKLMPDFCDRIERFCRKYEPGFDPAALIMSFQQYFTVPTPGMFGIAGVIDRDGAPELVAHVYGTVETFFGKRVMQIQHVWSDVPLSPRFPLAAAELLAEWGARLWNTTAIAGVARTPAVARLAALYGIDSGQTLLRGDLKTFRKAARSLAGDS